MIPLWESRKLDLGLGLAIEIQPNHIYYSNRANAYLELNQFDECIEDCIKAIELDKTFSKSYYR